MRSSLLRIVLRMRRWCGVTSSSSSSARNSRHCSRLICRGGTRRSASSLPLARELSLPVIVHDRDALADCLAIAKEFPEVRGVFHCYSGSVEMARELWKLGWYLGLDGPVTYKNARRTVEVAAEVPLERLLLETDSPYMAPVPKRGTRNDSRNIRCIAEKIAEIRNMTADAIIRVSAENGRRLFGI